jgi:hypothetical protein
MRTFASMQAFDKGPTLVVHVPPPFSYELERMSDEEIITGPTPASPPHAFVRFLLSPSLNRNLYCVDVLHVLHCMFGQKKMTPTEQHITRYSARVTVDAWRIV